jgi:hypothetical protein
MPLDLFVPGLIAPSDATAAMRELRLPAVERWLARAEVVHEAAANSSDALGALFGLAPPVPVAPVSLTADTPLREGTWMRADPVHVRVERDSIRLHPPEALDISRDDSSALSAALARHFAADGLELVAAAPDRWYLRLPASEVPHTTALEEAVGRDLRKLLPSSSATINWAALLTEAQMVLSAQDANAARERQGKAPINSVWFWGAGTMPTQLTSSYTSVCADDAFARGLATLAGSRLERVPAHLDAVPSTSHALVVLAEPAKEIASGNADRWAAVLRAIEAAWFEPMSDALARFGSVRLLVPGERRLLVASLTSRARWRVFRRTRPMVAYA